MTPRHFGSTGLVTQRNGHVGKSKTDPGPPVERLSKRYGSVVAVNGVDAEIREGELVSFVGPSGCGKTTLLRMIGGFARPDGGRVLLDGHDVTRDPPNRRATAMVFQSYALFPHLTVAGNVGYALRVRGQSRGGLAARVEDLLRVVRLDGLGGRRPDELSGGQQQRVALARALSVRPRALLSTSRSRISTPTFACSCATRSSGSSGSCALTVAYVTHDQEEAMSISDRIAVMRAGRIEQVGAPTEIYERPATEFVARFVGTANFLDGELASNGRDRRRRPDPLGDPLRARAPGQGSRWARGSGSSSGRRPCASSRRPSRPTARRACPARSSA